MPNIINLKSGYNMLLKREEERKAMMNTSIRSLGKSDAIMNPEKML
jgi:hypothetical protein